MTFIYACVLIACTNEEEKITPRTYPRVRSYPVTNITNTGVLLQGEITFIPATSEGAIVEYGFMWSKDSEPLFGLGNKFSFGSTTEAGKYEYLIESGLERNVTYQVRAYAKTASLNIYGELFEFRLL